MGFFNSGADAQQVCAVLQRREKVLSIVTSRKVDDLIEEAYALDPRLCGCIEGWSGNHSAAGTLGLKQSYRLNLEYSKYTPPNINDVIVDNGRWRLDDLLKGGEELPDYVVIVTKGVDDLQNRLNESLNDLRSNCFGLLGATYYTTPPSGEYSSVIVEFQYCVDPSRAKMWMQSAQRRVSEIDRSCFGTAPKLIKVFLAFSYLQQQCMYDQESSDLISAKGDEAQLSKPWVRLPYGPLCRGEGICEGIAAAFKMFMDYFGIENRIVFGRAGEGNDTDPHSWNMVRLGDQWFHVDATAGIGGEGVYVGAFLKCDSDMEHMYLWDVGSTPRCVVRRPDYSSVETYVDEHFDDLLASGVEERYMRPEDITE